MSLRERKTAKKKREIIRAATEIVSEKGYHGTTMEEIAATLLMTKGSVYYYFKNKQDLLYQCFTMLLHESIVNITKVEAVDLHYEEKLRQAMVVHIRYVLKERGEFRLLSRQESPFTEDQLTDILNLRNEYEQLFDQIIVAGIKEELFLEVDVKIARNLILGAMNWMVEWYSEDGKQGLEAFSETIADYLLRIVLDPKNEWRNSNENE